LNAALAKEERRGLTRFLFIPRRELGSNDFEAIDTELINGVYPCLKKRLINAVHTHSVR
jgi:hypothetical protein